MDKLDQHVRTDGFGDMAIRSCRKRDGYVLGESIGRQDRNGGMASVACRLDLANEANRRQAVHDRHLHVHKDEVEDPSFRNWLVVVFTWFQTVSIGSIIEYFHLLA